MTAGTTWAAAPAETESPAPTLTTGGGSLNEALDTSTPCTGICGWVADVTGQEGLGRWTVGIGDTVLRVLLILVVGLVLRWLLHRTISRLSESIATGRTGVGRGSSRRPRAATALLESSPLASERRQQRSRTIGSVLRSTSTGVIAGIVVLMLLGEFGIDLAPLLAGAGVLGVALGFGSQTLVKDFLSGLFMIVEDQYGVGDVVDVGEATGTVEAVGLRVTRLRDVSGTVWYVRNGEILRVGNQSQGWARAVLDVSVGYGEDVQRVQLLLAGTAERLVAEPDWAPLVLEAPEVWGVEQLSADAVVVRLVVKTVPLEQWKVARELRRRIKAAFDAQGVEIPFAQRTVWLRQGAQDFDGPPGAPDADTASAAGEQASQPPPPGESEVAADVDPRRSSEL